MASGQGPRLVEHIIQIAFIMIRVEHLQKTYQNGLAVLKDVNCIVNKGDVISIIGPSGTGKSTFLNCLNLLEQPTAGSIWIDGENILDPKCNVPKMRQKMGMVFQNFNLFDHLSIMDNLTLGPVKLLGKTREEAEDRAYELLKMVGLAEKAAAMPSSLSGGQKQRVAIARTLAMNPEIILFDEPTSALDPTMVSEVLSVIRTLAKTGITMLIVTHEMSFARDVSNRIFFMDKGYIWEDGSPEQIFENPKTNEARVFINRIRGLHFDIESCDYDLYKFNAMIEQFGSKYFFSGERITSLLHVVEEVLAILDCDKGISIDMEYSEKGDDVSLKVLQRGVRKSILNDEDVDELSLAIIHGSCDSIDERIVEEGVELSFEIAQ